MSLLDDVSIVVTPNGYKAGTLYGVLPTATEGAEIIQNVDFSSDTWWQKSSANVNISNGKGNYTAGTTEYFYKPNILTVGKRYKLVYEITDFTTGYISALAGNWSEIQTAVGTYEIYFTCIDDDFGLVGNTFVGSIDNVSVKEVTNSDMDVTRATAATRVDENGLVNYAEVLGSEIITNGDFSTDSGWTIGTGWSISGGKANATDAAFNSQLSDSTNLVAGKVYKISFDVSNYVKGNVNVTVGNVSSSTVSSDGSYTFYLTTSLTTPFRFSTYAGGSGTTLSVDNVSVKEADRNNVPRIDYTGGGCPHILAEPQSTNLVTYSEDFSQSSWSSPSSMTLTPNDSISPNGLLNATKLNFTNPSSTNALSFNYTTIAVTYSSSIFVKYIDAQFIQLWFGSTGFGGGHVNFDLINGLKNDLSGAIGSITDVGNGWFKISATKTSTGGATDVFAIVTVGSLNSTRFGDEVDGSVYIWGSQVEEKSYPTSYIPTSGSSVTRNQDIFTRDGIGSLINSTEGVLFAEIAALADDLTRRRITLSDGTTNNRINLYFENVSNTIEAFIKGSSGNDTMVYSSSDTTQFHKIAVSYKDGGSSLWVNGLEVDTSLSIFNLSNLSDLDFSQAGGSETFFGKVKQLQVYKTALTDAQLTSLTT